MLVYALLSLRFPWLFPCYQAVASDEGGDDDSWSDIWILNWNVYETLFLYIQLVQDEVKKCE